MLLLGEFPAEGSARAALYNLAADPDRVACDMEGRTEIREDDREDVVRSAVGL
jgi:hypothetical protein